MGRGHTSTRATIAAVSGWLVQSARTGFRQALRLTAAGSERTFLLAPLLPE